MSDLDKKIPIFSTGAVSSLRDYREISLIQLDAFPVITGERAVIWLEDNPSLLMDTVAPPVAVIADEAAAIGPTEASQVVSVTTIIAGTVDISDPESDDYVYLENQASSIGPSNATQEVTVTSVIAGTVDISDPESDDYVHLENQASAIGPSNAIQEVTVTTIIAGTIEPPPVVVTDSAAFIEPKDVGTSHSVNVTRIEE